MERDPRSQARFWPVDDPFTVKVLQTTADLGWIEDGSGLVEAGVTHVVDMELEVTTIHEGQDKTQCLLRLIGIGQTHLHIKGSGVSFVFMVQSRWFWRQEVRRRQLEAYNKSAVDLLQDLLLVQCHGLAFALLNSLLLKLLAGVHLPRGSDLTRTHLRERNEG